MIKPKKALLDTDFLFKTQLAQNVKREALAELVINFEGYDFFAMRKFWMNFLIMGSIQIQFPGSGIRLKKAL